MRGRVAKALRGMSTDWAGYRLRKEQHKRLRRAGVRVPPLPHRVGQRAIDRAVRNGRPIVGFERLQYRYTVVYHADGRLEVVA